MRAFVIMPYAEEFNPIYDDLLEPILKKADVKAQRGDTEIAHKNIMQKVVEGILEANFVLADLTDNNPNVFYELGIAHAREKPVILLTQSIDTVPFDLRSYSVIEYDTHFAKVAEAREKLSEAVREVLDNPGAFSNPVSDFAAAAESAPEAAPEVVPEDDALERIKAALDSKWKWRTVTALSEIARVPEGTVRRLVDDDPDTRRGRGKSGNEIAGLIKRVGKGWGRKPI